MESSYNRNDDASAVWQPWALLPDVVRAGNPATSADDLAALLQQYDAQLTLAMYEDLPPEELLSGSVVQVTAAEKMALAVWHAVAGNPNMDMQRLVRIAPYFPRAFLENPLLPFLLLADPYFLNFAETLALRILRCQQVPGIVLATLGNSSSSNVRQAASLYAEVRLAPDDATAPDPSAERTDDLEQAIAAAIAAYDFGPRIFGTPYQYERAIQFPDVVPAWLLAGLGQSQQDRLRRMVRYLSPIYEEKILRYLYKQDERDYMFQYFHPEHTETPQIMSLLPHANLSYGKLDPQIAYPGLDEEQFARFAGDPRPNVRYSVAYNELTPASVLDVLVDDAEIIVKLMAARNHNTLQASLRRLYGWILRTTFPTAPPLYRVIALAGPIMSPIQLARHVAAPSWLERLAIARNPSAPLDTLRILAEDGIPLVRKAARAAIQSRMLAMLSR